MLLALPLQCEGSVRAYVRRAQLSIRVIERVGECQNVKAFTLLLPNSFQASERGLGSFSSKPFSSHLKSSKADDFLTKWRY